METKTTIRIYYENGAKIKGASFWKRLWNNNFGSELLIRAKEAGLEQAIAFNVTEGYLANSLIQYNLSDIKSGRLPQCVEITGSNEKIEKFLLEEKVLLSMVTILIIKNEVEIAN